jgi:hypothetical protein
VLSSLLRLSNWKTEGFVSHTSHREGASEKQRIECGKGQFVSHLAPHKLHLLSFGRWAPDVEAQDDKLPGLVVAGNAWGLDDEPLDSRGDKRSVNDLEHGYPVCTHPDGGETM